MGAVAEGGGRDGHFCCSACSGESGQESLNEARSDKSLAMFLAVFYIFTLRNVSTQHD